MKAVIVGAGLTGASAAWKLRQAGWDVHVTEAEDEAGGNCRTGSIGGVIYERFGPHIFHTNDDEVARFAQPWLRPYEHRVESLTSAGKLHWPPQISQLKTLPEWPRISHELANRPAHLPPPGEATFEEYAIALMGQTLYRIFIHGYTWKQWDRDPAKLSAIFAPKRIDLRDDDYLPLFRDRHQGWLDGMQMCKDLLADCEITLGERAHAGDVSSHDALIVTAALDDFLEDAALLEWRGNHIVHSYQPGSKLRQETGCINLATTTVAPVRVTETRHMTGQEAGGSVLSYEYPQAGIRSLPVNDAAGQNRGMQRQLERLLTEKFPFAVAAGRLGRYTYIDMDGAIRQGWHAAQKIMKLHANLLDCMAC
jgi:UDP-galactopyranose mutase